MITSVSMVQKNLQSNETSGTKRMVENILIWIKLLTMWYNGSSQTLSSIRILWRACSCADGQVQLSDTLIQLVWGGAQEFACLSSQVMLVMLLSGMTLSEPLHICVCGYTYTHEYIYICIYVHKDTYKYLGTHTYIYKYMKVKWKC